MQIDEPAIGQTYMFKRGTTYTRQTYAQGFKQRGYFLMRRLFKAKTR